MSAIKPGAPICVLVRIDGIAYFTGEVVEDDETAITIRRATWHRSTGRHSDFMGGADSTEREAYPAEALVRISRHAIALMVDWPGNLDAGTA